MLGDVLLITDRHRRGGRELAERIRALPAARPVVAIAGESGSGKSELAHTTARALKDDGVAAKILGLDSYYRIPPAERAGWRRLHGIAAVGDEEMDWPAIERHVGAFRRGEEVTLPIVDFFTERVDRLVTSFGGVGVLIVEGLYASRAPADLKVFIDLTYHDTTKAQVVRGKEVQDDLRARVLEREHQVVQSHRSLADLVITPDFEVVAATPGG